MAGKTDDPFVKAVLEGLHEEEVSHEKKLHRLLDSLKPTGA